MVGSRSAARMTDKSSSEKKFRSVEQINSDFVFIGPSLVPPLLPGQKDAEVRNSTTITVATARQRRSSGALGARRLGRDFQSERDCRHSIPDAGRCFASRVKACSVFLSDCHIFVSNRCRNRRCRQRRCGKIRDGDHHASRLDFCTRPNHLPVNTGARFSTNARAASL